MADIILTEGADNFIGSSENEFIYGRGGNDTIDGGAGNDWIYGGTGAIDPPETASGDDTLRGGAGDDMLFGADGNDRLEGGDGNDQIAGDMENTPVPGNDLLFGNSGFDILNGWGGNDTLDGGSGSDVMSGGLGNDTYYVDDVNDNVNEGRLGSRDGNGVDKVISSISFSLIEEGRRVDGDVENLTLTGTAGISGVGNSFANIIAGNAANNGLYGLHGNDTINGLGGQDVIYGGPGNDRLIGGTGPDRFVFNSAANASTNLDTITDFNVKDDNIWIDNAVFTAIGANGLLAASAFHIGASAHDANDRIIYNSATGALIYDSNGNAAGGAVQFAALSKGLAMTNADFLII